ncbi:MAG TPA: DedA family protein [Actinomycetales bacterium]
MNELTGLSGWVADVMAALGAWGVGLLTMLETVFPPIPSEVVLPLAGYLAERGRMGLVAVLVAATLGGVVGALVLYEVARRLGEARSAALVARIPLVDREDVDRAIGWFGRHGGRSVFIGRLVPGVRSLISLPAGAASMPLGRFVAFTTAGTLVWNSVLIGAGYALGSQWQQAEQYSSWFNSAIYVALAAFVGWLVVRRVRKRRAA